MERLFVECKMQVKNLGVGLPTDCRCNSWLDHWEEYSGRRSLFCSELFCDSFAVVASHVAREDERYILPLCLKHARQTGEKFEVRDSSLLLHASTEEACCAD